MSLAISPTLSHLHWNVDERFNRMLLASERLCNIARLEILLTAITSNKIHAFAKDTSFDTLNVKCNLAKVACRVRIVRGKATLQAIYITNLTYLTTQEKDGTWYQR